MTPSDTDMTIIRPLAAARLVVRDPSGKTRQVPLATGRMTVGRGEDCALVLDFGDQAASRHHAVIIVDGPVVVVEDAGSTNGIFVNEARVTRSALRPGDVLRLGGTTMTVEDAASPAPPPPRQAAPAPAGRGSRRRIILYLALLGMMGVALWLAAFSGKDTSTAPAPTPASQDVATPEAPASQTAPAPDVPTTPRPEAGVAASAPATPATPPEPAPAAPQAAPPAKPTVSAEAAEKSQEHARQALFFYNSGKIGLAITEWEKAVTLDPGNGPAAKWLARAEGERDQLMDKHYREGLAAIKYSRRDEAMEHFRFVVEHCRAKTDERCLDARRQLGLLEGKTP